nr:hypothetical protein [Tanacetum cinerariifolium]
MQYGWIWLMLLSMTYYYQLKVNVAKHKLTTAGDVNEDVQIRALIDGKKIIVTEASIRCDLQLQDAEEITLVDETQGRINEEEMFGVNDLDGDEVIVDATISEEVEQSTKVAKKEVCTVDPVTTAGEVVTTTEDVKVTTATTTPQISKYDLHWLSMDPKL